MRLFSRFASALRAKRHGSSSVRNKLHVETLERREVLTAVSTLWQLGSGVYDLSQTFLLHSNPTAKQVVYLDFNGHTTGDVYGTSWDNLTSPAWDLSGNGPSFTTVEQQTIQRIWARVAEDFVPFNIDITTQDPGVEALRKTSSSDSSYGVRVVITPNDKPAPGSGGVAYVGSFTFNTDTPAYVFNVSEKSVAEAASHEVGHTLGLKHDGTSTQGYYGGQGSGATSWGPIMGAAYSPVVTQWSKGEYSGANNKEDDLAKITTLNGFTYRPDDYGNSLATATALLPQGASQVGTKYGIVEKNTDSDWFSFWSNPGTVSLKIDPVTLGPNLAVRADLYNAAGVLLTTVNPPSALNAVVNFTVPAAGQYFLRITGTGKGSPLTTGFSNYASLGNYRITGSVQAYSGIAASAPVEANVAPVANADSVSTLADTPLTISVLANDTDSNGDVLTITGISGVKNGSATIVGDTIVFAPAAGYTGAGSFTYSVSDGNGGTSSATVTVGINAPLGFRSFLKDTDLAISKTAATTVRSKINVSGMTGTIEKVTVKLSIYHTWVNDLQITLIAPDGTRIPLFNRDGGSGDNILKTTFDDGATLGIWEGKAPFGQTYLPWGHLSDLNGKNPNGTWKLEIKDNYYLDGGRLDRWKLSITTGTPTTTTTSSTPATSSSGLSPFIVADTSNRPMNDLLTNWFQPTSQTQPTGWNVDVSRPDTSEFTGFFRVGKHQASSPDWFVAEFESDLPAWNE